MAKIHKIKTATVLLWGKEVGVVAWDEDRRVGSFQYTPDFVRGGYEIAPLMMPLDKDRIYAFPALNKKTYLGLPGLVADALPDHYGNTLIDIWLRQQGRDAGDFNPVERLCYMGTRGMGALEFKPAIGPQAGEAIPIEIAELTQPVSEVLQRRTDWTVDLKGPKAAALKTIIQVGTSAGGARAKAVIAWNPKTSEVRSGQFLMPEGFEPWLLKFDGSNRDMPGDPEGLGRIEYTYHKMATAAGIKMSECRLLEEGGRAHFMTRRFDRTAAGDKIHLQSLCAIGHFDFLAPGEYSYEHVLGVIQQLNLGSPAVQAMYRRMVFNVIGRNQDDHTKNIAFLMDKGGEWRLAPAYDVVWCYNPYGQWSVRHQMRINGKQDNFTRDDLLSVADRYGIKNAKSIISSVYEAILQWPKFAEKAGVPQDMIRKVATTHRLDIGKP